MEICDLVEDAVAHGEDLADITVAHVSAWAALTHISPSVDRRYEAVDAASGDVRDRAREAADDIVRRSLLAIWDDRPHAFA